MLRNVSCDLKGNKTSEGFTAVPIHELRYTAVPIHVLYHLLVDRTAVLLRSLRGAAALLVLNESLMLRLSL